MSSLGAFTEFELKEWPALRLLVGEESPTSLAPRDLVMPINRDDDQDPDSTGLVISGFGKSRVLGLSMTWALALRYGIARKRWITPPCTLEQSLTFLRLGLDGKMPPWFDDYKLDHEAQAAVGFLNNIPLLSMPFRLDLGESIPDLDINRYDE